MSQTERIHQIIHLLESSRHPVPIARFLDELKRRVLAMGGEIRYGAEVVGVEDGRAVVSAIDRGIYLNKRLLPQASIEFSGLLYIFETHGIESITFNHPVVAEDVGDLRLHREHPLGRLPQGQPPSVPAGDAAVQLHRQVQLRLGAQLELDHHRVALGAQACHEAEKGAHTGEISAAMRLWNIFLSMPRGTLPLRKPLRVMVFPSSL